MMRSVFFIAIAGLLLSCQPEYRRNLQTAESLMDSRPDSALAIVSGMDINRMSLKRDKAHYALIASMAKDKNYIDTPEDSLINIAVDYYSGHGSSFDRMRALYYHGIVKINAKEYTAAVVSLEKAERLAEELNNLHYLGLIYRNKAAIFNATNNFETAINYSEKALSAFQNNGDIRFAEYMKYSLAMTYYNNRDIPKARQLFREIIDHSEESSLVSQAKIKYAMALLSKNDSIQVALDIYRSSPKYLFYYLDYGYYAYALAKNGQRDSADYWINVAHRFTNKTLSTATLESLLAHIDILNGDYVEAYHKVSNASHVQDSLTRDILQQSLSNAQRDYYQQEMKIQEGVVQRQRVIYITGGIIILLLFIITILFLWERKKQEEAQLKEQMASLALIQQSEQAGNRTLVGAWFMEKMARLSGLSNDYFSANALFEKEEVLVQFKQAAREFRQSSQWPKELIDNLNRYCSGVMDKLAVQVPSITGENKTIIALFFAGVPDSVIQLLMRRISQGSLRTLRSRLRKEIKDANPPDAQLFLDMLSTSKR